MFRLSILYGKYCWYFCFLARYIFMQKPTTEWLKFRSIHKCEYAYFLSLLVPYKIVTFTYFIEINKINNRKSQGFESQMIVIQIPFFNVLNFYLIVNRYLCKTIIFYFTFDNFFKYWQIYSLWCHMNYTKNNLIFKILSFYI